MEYNHYIAIDWAQNNMAIARSTAKSDQIKCFETASSVKDLKIYLKSLKGSKILTLEESTGSQWLYTELREEVESLIICDPRRNRLLSEGAKNDKIDARKLVQLLKANLLKEVFHTTDEIIYLRKLVSGYQDLVRSGVRLKNQRSALFRAIGQHHKKDNFESNQSSELFVMEKIDSGIKLYEEQKKSYEELFSEHVRKNKKLKCLKSLPGIGDIHAVQILAAVVDANRFPTKGKFLSYCGLVKHKRDSGGKTYGTKMTDYNRSLKCIFKMASFVVVRGAGPFAMYYQKLKDEKKLPEHVAKHAVARRIAVLSYGILKSEKKFEIGRFIEKAKIN